MLEQNKFLELLKEIVEVAKVQEGKITKEEVVSYFDGMDLTDQQFEAVYQYLGDNGIKIPGFVHKEVEQEKMEKTEKQEEDSVAHRLYLEEIQDINTITEEEKRKLVLAIRDGQEQAKTQLFNGYLSLVVELAQRYSGKGMPIEDLEQEGNIALFQAIEKVGEIAKLEDVDTFLTESVRQAMVEAVDEEIGNSDWENSMLAKSNLVNEAAKYLAEDLGRVATVQELAEYTRLTEQEILDLRTLSLDAIKVGKGE